MYASTIAQGLRGRKRGRSGSGTAGFFKLL